MIKRLLLLLLLFPVLAHAQASVPSTYVPQLITYQGTPFGTCAVYQIAENVTNGAYYTCNPATSSWAAVGGGGGGSVTGCLTTGGIAYENGTSNTLTCNTSFAYTPTSGGLSISSTNNGPTNVSGSVLTLNNPSGGLSTYVVKDVSGNFQIRNGNDLIAVNGVIGIDNTGQISLIGGNNGAQTVWYQSASVSPFGVGSVVTSFNATGSGPHVFALNTTNPGLFPGYISFDPFLVGITMGGGTSGSAAIGVAAVAGTPCMFTLPTVSATAGQYLTSAAPSGGNCQASWHTASFADLAAVTNSQAGTFALSGNTWDAHSAAHTLPAVSGTVAGKPGTCTVGEEYFATDASAGQNMYYCTTSNVWTQQLNSGAAGASTSLGNLSAVAINTTLLPASVNTVALCSATLPCTNVFLGTQASKALSFAGLSSLTANRTITVPDANTVTVQSLGSGTSHKWISFIDSTGTQNLTQPTLADIAAGAAPTGTFDFSGTTIFKARVGAALTTTVNGDIGYDTTNKNWHVWQNGADQLMAVLDGTQVTGDCPKYAITASVVNLTDNGVCVTSSSTNTFTNKTYNAESTGNAISVPAKALFPAAGCASGSTAAPGLVTGSSNVPTPQCAGTTVPKGILQFARGNAAYISAFQLPSDWNASAATDIQICFTTTDTTNGHITSFNVQTGFNKTDGTVTDDPSLNALQAASVTTGASQVSGGQLCATLTSMTMTGSNPGYNMEVAITRNNSGTDTNTDTAVAVKYATLTFGRTMNAANR